MARYTLGTMLCLPLLAAASVQYAVAKSSKTSPQGISIQVSSNPLPIDNTAIAWATYNDSISAIGWATLEVHTSSWSGLYADSQQAYAAGYLEGSITVQRAYEYITNAWGNQTYDNGLDTFLYDNIKYVQQQVAANGEDSYWHQVGLVYEQLQGLYDGYNATAPASQAMGFLQYYSSTLQGDLHDLNTVFAPPAKRELLAAEDEGCSLMVKLVGTASSPSELLFAHTTWSKFESMTRFYKMYDFPWSLTGNPNDGQVPARYMAFSSYPGAIFSGDDWYITSTNLAIAETTIANNNPDLWEYVKPTTVLEWARNMVANRLATDGPSWSTTFSRENSGTYNNMWHVIDYKLFQPGKPLADNTLWVLEQMPGPYIKTSDHTDVLRTQSYWASFNRIADPFLFNLTGQWELVSKYGVHFTYTNTSRAQIFRRDYAKVVDEASLMKMIRYNDFHNDPLSIQGCPGNIPSASNAIACRGDLDIPGIVCVPQVGYRDEAGTDAKVTSYALMQQGALAAYAQAGPTHDVQPAFNWANTTFNWLPHAGHPDVWNFPWVPMSWKIPPHD